MAYKRIAVSEETHRRAKNIADSRGITMFELIDELTRDCDVENDDNSTIVQLTDEQHKQLRAAKQINERTTVSITMETRTYLSFLHEWTGQSKAKLLRKLCKRYVVAWLHGESQISMY